jgi:hypothetical protein
VTESLGTARLTLEVDSKALTTALDSAKKSIEGFRPDFKGVEQGLRNISNEADKSATRVQSLNQVLNQAPAASYSKISAQISRLTAESRNLKLASEEYLKTLQRIRELELVRNNRAGRQRVNADFEAYQGRVMNGGYGDPSRLPSLPNTTAADIQLIRELSDRLRNVDRTSAQYDLTLRELEAAQLRVSRANSGTSQSYRQLQREQEGAIRRSEKLAGIQQYYADKSPRAGGIRNEAGAITARGANSVADERAYNAAIRPAKELLDTDLKRLQALREISQRILTTAASTKNGFGAFSASIGGDAVSRSIRRNEERNNAQSNRRQAQLDALEADLARVREQRLATERQKLEADRREQVATQKAARAAERVASDRANRRKDALGSALIGGAFPALFGQGLGASVGGALGGGAGGAIGGQFGFGLSLVGTAVGAQFDLMLQKGRDLARGLEDPIKNFEQLAEASSFSSKATESYIRGLIETGRTAEAQAQIQQDLLQTFGSTQALDQYNAALDTLNRSWGQASVAVANFVAGPLASLINQLSQPGSNLGTGVRFEQLAGALTPDQYRTASAARDRATEASRQSRGGISAFLPPSEGDVTKGRQAFIQEAERLLGIEKQREDIQERIANAQALSNEALSTSYRLIDASVQGNERQTLELKKQEAINQRNQKLLALTPKQREGPEGQKIQQDTAKQLYELNLQSNNYTASVGRRNAEQEIGLSKIQRQIDAENQLARVAEGPYKEFLKQKIGIEETTAAAEDRVKALGARLDELRGKGASPESSEYQDILSEQTLAAKEVELTQTKGAAALKEASADYEKAMAAGSKKQLDGMKEAISNVQQLRNQLESAAKAFRSALEGSFDLLTKSRQGELLKAARADVQRAVSAGFFDPSAVSKLKGRDLLSAASQARSVIDADSELATVNTALTKATEKLVAKDWNVYVSAPGSGGLARSAEVYQ